MPSIKTLRYRDIALILLSPCLQNHRQKCCPPINLACPIYAYSIFRLPNRPLYCCLQTLLYEEIQLRSSHETTNLDLVVVKLIFHICHYTSPSIPATEIQDERRTVQNEFYGWNQYFGN